MSIYGMKAHPLDNPKTLYDRLGFAERSVIPYWLVRRSTAPPFGRE